MAGSTVIPMSAARIANLEREARQEGRTFSGAPFAIELRCKDKDACTERAMTRQHEPSRHASEEAR